MGFVVRFAILLAISFTLAIERVRAEGDWSLTKVLFECKIATNGSPIVIPARFGERECNFVVDTGAAFNLIDDDHKDILGDPVDSRKVGSPAGPVEATFYRPLPIRLGTCSIQMPQQICCLDLNPLGQLLGQRIDGILGIESLKHYLLALDFDRGRLSLAESEQQLKAPPGECTPIELRTYGPIVSCRLGEPRQKVVFLIDTGYTGTAALHERLFDLFEQNGDIQRLEGVIQSVSVDGTIRSQQKGRCNLFSLGDSTHREVVVKEDRITKIGLSLLARHRVAFDFPRSQLYLQPGKKFHWHDHSDCDGLEILSQDGRHIVGNVSKGSLGELAKIRTGDEIVSVDGVDARLLSRYDMVRKLSSLRIADMHVELLQANRKRSVVVPESYPRESMKD